MKILLKVPGYTDTTFDNYENLNFIWEIIENYPNAKLEIVDENKETIVTDKDDVKESIDTVVNVENSDVKEVTLKYIVPKQVTFTQRFQDRLNTDISDILDSVYPNFFVIDSIKFEDNDEITDSMNMYIIIKALNEEATNSLSYLDKNVEYIIKDLVDYYIK